MPHLFTTIRNISWTALGAKRTWLLSHGLCLARCPRRSFLPCVCTARTGGLQPDVYVYAYTCVYKLCTVSTDETRVNVYVHSVYKLCKLSANYARCPQTVHIRVRVYGYTSRTRIWIYITYAYTRILCTYTFTRVQSVDNVHPEKTWPTNCRHCQHVVDAKRQYLGRRPKAPFPSSIYLCTRACIHIYIYAYTRMRVYVYVTCTYPRIHTVLAAAVDFGPVKAKSIDASHPALSF